MFRDTLFSLRRTASLVVLFCVSVLQGHAADTLDPVAVRLRDHVKILASDEMQGRGSGTEGNRKAAQYIAEQFKKAGLQPIGGSYLQEFPIQTSVKLGKENRAQVDILVVPEGLSKEQGRLQTIKWQAGREYTPMAFSKDTTITAPVVFAGYGITAKEQSYDDYANVDVTDKLVIVLRGTPEYTDMRKKFSEKNKGGDDPHGNFNDYSSLRYKALNARQHGAVGIMYVSPQGDSADVLLPVQLERGGSNSGIVVIHTKRSILGRIFTKNKSVYKAEEKIIATKKPASFLLEDVTITVAADLEPVMEQTANVIGMIPGSDPELSQQYIVVGAHFDHLGMGGEGSLHASHEPAIHYGADDNASGTAGAIELSSRLAANPLPRSVIVMAFSGEEMGLLGSKFYTEHPSIPLSKTMFMLNMDMIGRMKNEKLNIHGSGTAKEFDELIKSKAEPLGLSISTSADGFGPSDHTSFYLKEIPVMFLFTGLHEDYHRPTDTWDKLNYPGQAKTVQFAEDILRSVGSNSTKLTYTKVESSSQSRSTQFNVYIGTMPDYSDHPKGMRLTGVRAGSPAEKAGLKEGDVIVKVGEIDVKNVYDYTHSLSMMKAGEKVKVEILRGPKEDQRLTLDLTPEARK